MKVLHVSHTGALGGAERSLCHLLRALPGDVDSVLAAPPGDLERTAPVEVRQLPEVNAAIGANVAAGVASIAVAARALRRIALAERPDLVHANSLRAGLVVCAAALRVPVAVSIRDCLPPGLRTRLVRLLIHRRADLLIANSHYTASQFGGTVRVVYPPIDLESFRPERLPDPEALRRDLGLDPRATVLAVVGQLTPWKGQDLAIRVLARLRSRHPSLVLLVVGAVAFESGTYDNLHFERELRELVRELGLEREVLFVGARDDVPALLRALDVLLVPSVQEPFGRVVAEALAAGTGVIATSVGGPAELLTDGVLGRLVAARDEQAWAAELETVLSDPAWRSDAAREHRRSAALRFDRGHHGEQMARIYRELVSEP